MVDELPGLASDRILATQQGRGGPLEAFGPRCRPHGQRQMIDVVVDATPVPLRCREGAGDALPHHDEQRSKGFPDTERSGRDIGPSVG